MHNLSEAVAEKAAKETYIKTRNSDISEFNRAMDIYRSRERDRDVYRKNDISEEVIDAVIKK